ncbi:winged helix-turn-helix transcriptional regulator [Streptomyces sp. SID6673]|nr:winged helix-turn-helix transcriptional regulator [Streptomyces sp. SID11726]NEB27136.1 winged helix-turn-helix transcriptional regulator [Streptomyces sp. SID6673]
MTTSDDVFLALANPVRRRLLELLAAEPTAAGELGARFALSRSSVAEHLKVLKDAGLVTDEARGRHRIYHLTAAPLADLNDWLHPFERFWRARLTDIADIAEDLE